MSEEIIPVIYRGKMSFNSTPKIDIGSLEAKKSTIGHVLGLDVKPGYYDCFYALHEDRKRVGALMVAHESYPGESLVTNEKIGEILVGLSGVVGFFCSPKTEYSFKQLGRYIDDLKKRHTDENVWAELNSRQFVAKSSQTPGSAIDVWGHRGEDGKIDALRLEFRRVGEKNPVDVANKLDKEEKKHGR